MNLSKNNYRNENVKWKDQNKFTNILLMLHLQPVCLRVQMAPIRSRAPGHLSHMWWHLLSNDVISNAITTFVLQIQKYFIYAWWAFAKHISYMKYVLQIHIKHKWLSTVLLWVGCEVFGIDYILMRRARSVCLRIVSCKKCWLCLTSNRHSEIAISTQKRLPPF